MSTVLQQTETGYSYRGETTLTVCVCDVCGITYAVPQRMYDNARELGQSKITWCCPKGHSGIGFHGLSEAERERRAMERERSRANANGEHALEMERRYAATTKARKRHAAGVCPACKRSFKQIREHMERMHPDYDPSQPAT
jgi:hypothetical protein